MSILLHETKDIYRRIEYEKFSDCVTKGEAPYNPQEVGYEEEWLEVLNGYFKKLIQQDMLQSAIKEGVYE